MKPESTRIGYQWEQSWHAFRTPSYSRSVPCLIPDMASDFQLFHRFWASWGAKLEIPVKRNRARLVYPSTLVESKRSDGAVELKPASPLCILNAPQKGSSTRRGASHRQAIVIDGTFVMRHDANPPFLVEGSCCIAIFDTEEVPGTSLVLREIEAMHFDMEKEQNHTPFHPGFHVQRGSSNRLLDEVIKPPIALGSHMPVEKIRIDRATELGTPYLRLPTPQMDLFSVMTMVIADFFCSSNPKDPKTTAKVTAEFKALLALLFDGNNAAREGFLARRIRTDGEQRKFMSIGGWYAECP